MGVNETNQPSSGRNWVAGLILVAIGAVLLAGNISGFGGEAVVLAIGLAFLVAYALRREYGFLVPGGILTGLGAGIVAQSAQETHGGAVVLGLGLGFFLIYVIDWVMTRAPMRWWPLVPGTILSLVGLSLLGQQFDLLARVGVYWPVLLILAGLFILFSRRR